MADRVLFSFYETSNGQTVDWSDRVIGPPWLPVVCLFLWRGPTAICGFVISVIVNAFYGEARPPRRKHIIPKVDERCGPSFADPYSPPAVSNPVLIVGVVAAGTHGAPHVKNGVMSESVPSGPNGSHFPSKTTTRLGFSTHKPLATNGQNGAAGAFANPIGPGPCSGSVFRPSDNAKPAKLFSGMVCLDLNPIRVVYVDSGFHILFMRIVRAFGVLNTRPTLAHFRWLSPLTQTINGR